MFSGSKKPIEDEILDLFDEMNELKEKIKLKNDPSRYEVQQLGDMKQRMRHLTSIKVSRDSIEDLKQRVAEIRRSMVLKSHELQRIVGKALGDEDDGWGWQPKKKTAKARMISSDALGELCDARKKSLNEMLDYMANPLALRKGKGDDDNDKTKIKMCPVGVVVDAPGAGESGKSVMLQRAYCTPLVDCELDRRTMRLMVSYGGSMSNTDGAKWHLASRVVFNYFCGQEDRSRNVDVSDVLKKIGDGLDAYYEGDVALDRVLNVLEANFAHEQHVDWPSVRTMIFVDEAPDASVRRDVCRALDAIPYEIGNRGAIFTALSPHIGEGDTDERAVKWFTIEPDKLKE